MSEPVLQARDGNVVTLTLNEPERDPCRCGSARCRRFINFDLSNRDAQHCESETAEGTAFRARFQEYADYLVSIGQEQVLDVIGSRLNQLRRSLQ